MTSPEGQRLSRRAINRAGDVVRRVYEGKPVEGASFFEAWSVVTAFRAEWSAPPFPLTKVNMGLRSMAGRCTNRAARVTQRLKRTERIIDKLKRFPSMNLVQMQDIGGCRAVVPRLDQLERLRDRIREQWSDSLVEEYDYVDRPKASGYRAVHVVVRREDHLVEIQLRTHRQHRWAASVEYAEARDRTWLRDADIQTPLASAFRDLGEAFAAQDRGEPVRPDLAVRLKSWLGALD